MTKRLKYVTLGLLTSCSLSLPNSTCDASRLQGSASVTAKANASYVSPIKKGHKPTRKQLCGNPRYREAIGYFNKKNYAAAIKDFQLLDSSGYCCDMVHYYIAQCYQNTNQTIAAEQHYNWVLEMSKDKTLRAYADYANQTLAYYGSHRTYAGQGNNFSTVSGGGGGGGGRIGFG